MPPRRNFGATWWGKAWVGALQGRAALDPNRLGRGRTYARQGHVHDMVVEPGVARALVSGSRRTPYKSQMKVRTLTEAEWDRLERAIVAKAGHLAALLDGELLPEVVQDASDAGIELLPVSGELIPRCSCPDWAELCKHAAAVCYLVADELDADPFALLLLRGRSRDEVLAGLRRRRSGAVAEKEASTTAAHADEGVDPRAAFAFEPRPIPPPPAPPPRPGRPVLVAMDPPPGSGVTAEALQALAEDAARLAWELAVGDRD